MRRREDQLRLPARARARRGDSPSVAAEIAPFRIEVTEAELTDLRDRLERTRWPEAETVDDCVPGRPARPTPRRMFHGSGRRGYDSAVLETPAQWAPAEFGTKIDGLGFHLLHVPSARAGGALPPGADPRLARLGGRVLEGHRAALRPDPASSAATPPTPSRWSVPACPGPGRATSRRRRGGERFGPHRPRAWNSLMGRLSYDRYEPRGGD